MKTLFNNNYNLNHHNLLTSSTSATVLNTSSHQLCKNKDSNNSHSRSHTFSNDSLNSYGRFIYDKNVGIVDDTKNNNTNSLNLVNHQQNIIHYQQLKNRQKDLIIDNNIMKKDKKNLSEKSEINNNSTKYIKNDDNDHVDDSHIKLKNNQLNNHLNINKTKNSNNNNKSNSMLKSKENKNGFLESSAKWTSLVNYQFHNLSKSDNILRLSLEANTVNSVHLNIPESIIKSKLNHYACNQKRNNDNSQLCQIDKLVSNGYFFQSGSARFEELASLSCTPKNEKKETLIKSPWDILCQIINCKVAFKKQFNGKKYNWIQLAGHAGRFKAGDREGFILKLMDNLERSCLEKLQHDVLASFVPKIDKILFSEDDKKYYTEMQDLLYGFHNPCIMDIKIGVRTFLENDLDDKETKPRHDLYVRLIEIDPEHPTIEEHKLQAITKRRYMTWRETSSCSSTLGFRIEAIKKNQVSDKEFFRVREKKEVLTHFRKYTDGKKNIIKMYLNRLKDLDKALNSSSFFYSHEIIGSSLLFVHDDTNANIWMIDFGKTRPLTDNIKLTHYDPWIEGNHEDGYLIGIQSLIRLFQELDS